MFFQFEILEKSENDISVYIPLIQNKKEADSILLDLEIYLATIGCKVFLSKWAEVKRDGSWFTEFSFSFSSKDHSRPKAAIELILNQRIERYIYDRERNPGTAF